jgi:hypothetical protein
VEGRAGRDEQVQGGNEHSEAEDDHEEDRGASVEQTEDEGALHERALSSSVIPDALQHEARKREVVQR